MMTRRRERPDRPDAELPDDEGLAVAAFVASLDLARLELIASCVNAEIALRREGKPTNPRRLH